MRWLCMFMLLALIGCEKQEEKPPSFPIKIATATQQDMPVFVKAVGKLSASLAVHIVPQVDGILTSVLFKDGQPVKQGDLLMTIDSRIYETAVQEAEAQLAIDQAKLKYALDFAETYGRLVGEEYVSRLDYEKGVQNVEVIKAAIENDLANLTKARIRLGYTELRSPADGYIGLRAFDPGNYVDTSQNMPLATIRKITPLCLSFALPEKYVFDIREAYKKEPLYLEAQLAEDPAHPLKGTLNFIDNTVNKQTGMIQLQGTVPNQEERGWPGQFVRVNLRLKILPNTVVVPTNALVLGENGFFIFVFNEETMTVEMRMAGKGIDHEGLSAVEWGVHPGEKVVVDGQLNLYDGAHVFIPELSKLG